MDRCKFFRCRTRQAPVMRYMLDSYLRRIALAKPADSPQREIRLTEAGESDPSENLVVEIEHIR